MGVAKALMAAALKVLSLSLFILHGLNNRTLLYWLTTKLNVRDNRFLPKRSVMVMQVAKHMELQIVFVHVEADNAGALALYNSLGYAVEDEEVVEVENLLRRPRRLLLSYWV